MGARKRLESAEISQWLSTHTGWEQAGNAITKQYKLADFASALAFAVKVGMAAEKRDHHPDLEIGWGRAKVSWTTHDAGGITALDLEMAERTDTFA